MATKKLIEVALPLEKINAESAREKSIRHGHLSMREGFRKLPSQGSFMKPSIRTE